MYIIFFKSERCVYRAAYTLFTLFHHVFLHKANNNVYECTFSVNHFIEIRINM